MKICTLCKAEKPFTEFNKHKGRKDGYDNKCRDCNSAACRAWNAANVVKVAEYNRYRYEQDPDAVKRRVKEWCKANPEQRERNRIRHRLANPERYAKYSSEWYEKNKDRHLMLGRLWIQNNLGKHKASIQNRRMRLKNAGGRISPARVEALIVLQKYKCASCWACIKSGFHVDHIMPLKRGGTNHDDNIQLLCARCNQTKSAKDPIAWAQSLGRLL